MNFPRSSTWNIWKIVCVFMSYCSSGIKDVTFCWDACAADISVLLILGLCKFVLSFVVVCLIYTRLLCISIYLWHFSFLNVSDIMHFVSSFLLRVLELLLKSC